MPKAYAPPTDEETYELQVEANRSEIETIIADTKWIVELIALLVSEAAVVAALLFFANRLFSEGLSVRVLSGTIVAAVFSYLLFMPTTRAIGLAVGEALLRLRRIVHIPADLQDRNISYRAVWQAILSAVTVAGVWGVAGLIEELVKHGAGGG